MTNIEELKKNYHGVYLKNYGVPILVSWDKLEPKIDDNDTVFPRLRKLLSESGLKQYGVASPIRYYYTDAFKAAWMANKFGMKYIGWEKELLDEYVYKSINDPYFKAFVAYDSTKMLQPSKGDYAKDAKGEVWQREMGAWKRYNGDFTRENMQIIERNGTAFMWPESKVMEQPKITRPDADDIMDILTKKVCMQMNFCSPEKTERGCAFCADVADDVIEAYLALKKNKGELNANS